MNNENKIKEKNKIMINDEDDYDEYNENNYEKELEILREIKEEEYYVETINNAHKSLLKYSKDNYLNVCEYLKYEDVENFLEKYVL